MKYQIVLMNKKGYIEAYHNFKDNNQDKTRMLEWIGNMIIEPSINKIEITRWNDKGERE